MKQEQSSNLGDYEVHKAWEGFASIRQISSGEIMHSRTAPMEEARQLYVEQSHLSERLRASSENEPPLVIWDAGLGAAANAMAAIECYEKVPAARPLRIVSFENDLDSLRLAFRYQEEFPYLRADAVQALLADGHWQSQNHAGLSWLLLPGDFLEAMSRAPAPDLIFYDMFSTKTSAQLWTASTFQRVFEACAGRAAELFTYTCSTANRAALLAAGFFVARGRNAGEKLETTIALTPAAFQCGRAKQRELLGRDWLGKWERSAAKFPGDIAPNERPAFEEIIRDHEQFRNSVAPERQPSLQRFRTDTGLASPAGNRHKWRPAVTRNDVAANNQPNKRGNIMADEKSGQKPDKEGGSGAEKGDESEAGGRRRHLLYTCWNDGAGNYVHANWSWFTCWRCGALNYM